MKILFNTYPMAFHTPGGGEIQLLNYCEQLPNYGADVELLDLWEPKFFSFDLVHFFSCMPGSSHFCAYVKKIGLPLFVSPNLWVTEETKHLYSYDEIRNQFVLADRIIGNSDMECDLLAHVFNMPREKFFTVYNGIDERFYIGISPNLFRKHYDIDGPFVLNVANIEPRKNQLNIIRALKNFPELKLVIIGYERDPNYLEQCLAEGDHQLLYLGSLPHDSDLLRSAYASCELFVLPSTLETPGLAALEASASGANVLVTSEGCAKEYFGEGVTYTNSNDSQGIAEGISVALSKENNFLSTFCIRVNFTWPYVVKSLSDLYESQIRKSDIEHRSIGFYPIEKDEQGLFAWSKHHIHYVSEKGILSFEWRAVEYAVVDILINGKVIDEGIRVGSGWSHYSLEIKSSGNQSILVIDLIIKPSCISPHNDPRELGIAVRRVKFNSQPLLVD